ncbi:NnrS family protein [Paracoccus aerodenitrificans]|uniref:NnrS family protein n=1 Tax=Paracoccus aerodenitrificans TaxID=3017781 RepID=UPI0022F1143E|nr:NnrS family protein [Paracoccus aerodenitrificans]WBU62782.1 NnrS family protein [Paracoccus aerodenitrificans]
MNMKQGSHLFEAGWRAFFWAAGIWAVLSMLIWVIWFASSQFSQPGLPGPGMPPQLWHAHEMVFGYATAALGGFFLTAVPNWTGAKAAPRRFVAMVFGLWLAGRAAVYLSGILPPVLVAVVDLAFLPVLAAKILTQLMARPKPQNMMFLLLLSMVWLSNLMVHLQWIGLTGTEYQGLRGGLLTICAMIAALGGRIIPAFTRNALIREGREEIQPVSHKPLDLAGTALPILTAFSVIIGMPDMLSAVLAIVAGLAAAARLGLWRGWSMRHQPIVWALHLAYAMLSLGLFCWGLALLGIGSEIGALHILGIGAIGGMTLAVMSRASLGHSGRPLHAPAMVAVAYGLLPVSVLLRWMASEFSALYAVGVIASGLIWIVVFIMYLFALWTIFFGPRAEGQQVPP